MEKNRKNKSKKNIDKKTTGIEPDCDMREKTHNKGESVGTKEINGGRKVENVTKKGEKNLRESRIKGN